MFRAGQYGNRKTPLFLPLFALAGFCGGPLLVSKVLEGAFSQNVAFVLSVHPVLFAVMGAYTIAEGEWLFSEKRSIQLGFFGCVEIAVMNLFALLYFASGHGREDMAWTCFCIAAGSLGMVIYYRQAMVQLRQIAAKTGSRVQNPNRSAHVSEHHRFYELPDGVADLDQDPEGFEDPGGHESLAERHAKLTTEELVELSLEFNPELTSLVKAMVEADSQETRYRVHEALLRRTLFVPFSGREQKIPFGEHARVDFQAIRYDGGGFGMLAFTDPYAMQLCCGMVETFFIKPTAEFLLDAVRNGATEVLINYDGAFGFRIMKEELPSLSKGMSPYSEEAMSEPHFLRPEQNLLEEQRETLVRVAQSRPEVRALYYFHVMLNEANGHRVVGIVYDGTDSQYEMLESALLDSLPELKVTYLRPPDEEFAGYMRKCGYLVYEAA